MLGKLIKHEYYYILKTFIPIYATFGAISILLKVFITIDPDLDMDSATTYTLSVLYICFAIAFVILFCLMGLMTIVHNSKRFKKNMFSDEGYLTNTLPVTVHEHIAAKLIAGGTNYIASLIIMLIGVLIVGGDRISFEFIKSIFRFITDMDISIGIKLLSFFIGLVGFCSFMLLCYVCSAADSMANSKGCIGAVIGIASYFLFSLGVALITRIAVELGVDTIEGILMVYLVMFLITGGILYFILADILKNKLNLQ